MLYFQKERRSPWFGKKTCKCAQISWTGRYQDISLIFYIFIYSLHSSPANLLNTTQNKCVIIFRWKGGAESGPHFIPKTTSWNTCPDIWLSAVPAATETRWCLPVCQRVLPLVCVAPFFFRTKLKSRISVKAHPISQPQLFFLNLNLICRIVNGLLSFPEWQMKIS